MTVRLLRTTENLKAVKFKGCIPPDYGYAELMKQLIYFSECKMERSKSISMRSINKIKNLERKIFEYEDEESEYVNRRAVAICERYIEKYLANVTPYESERKELRENIDWTCDNCTEKLEKLGWEVYGYL